MHTDKFKLLLVAILCGVLVGALPLFIFFLKGSYFPFWIFAGDAFLYLGIGQKSHFGFFTFDGIYPTNGFHPLWQYFVTLLAHAAQDNQLLYMNFVAWSSVALLCTGMSLLGCAIYKFTRSALLSVMIVPGYFYFFIGQSFSNMHTWNFLDGMESSLSILLVSLLAFVVAHFTTSITGRGPDGTQLAQAPPMRLFGLLGLILPFILLARLDEIFLLLSFGASILFIPTLNLGQKLPRRPLYGSPGGYRAYFVPVL